jgi:hypothetical protein
MTTMQDHIERLREEVPHPTKNNRYLVVPNTAAAYASSGGWGIYDTKRGWINFRDTELEAYRLLATILQSTDMSALMPLDEQHRFTVSVDGRFAVEGGGPETSHSRTMIFTSQDLAYGWILREMRDKEAGSTGMVYRDFMDHAVFYNVWHRGEKVTAMRPVHPGEN